MMMNSCLPHERRVLGEQILDVAVVPVPQVVEQVFGAPQISSQDRILQRTLGADSRCPR